MIEYIVLQMKSRFIYYYIIIIFKILKIWLSNTNLAPVMCSHVLIIFIYISALNKKKMLTIPDTSVIITSYMYVNESFLTENISSTINFTLNNQLLLFIALLCNCDNQHGIFMPSECRLLWFVIKSNGFAN